MPIKVAAGLALPLTGRVWPVPLYAQQASEWCWLACAQMAGDTPPHSSSFQQCALAQEYIAEATSCCASGALPSVCNRGGAVNTIQRIYSAYQVGFDPTPVPGRPAESDLATWLQKGPVQVFWTTPDQAHVALISGAQPIGGGKYRYTVNDPWPIHNGAIRPVTFDQLIPTIATGYDREWQCIWHC